MVAPLDQEYVNGLIPEEIFKDMLPSETAKHDISIGFAEIEIGLDGIELPL